MWYLDKLANENSKRNNNTMDCDGDRIEEKTNIKWIWFCEIYQLRLWSWMLHFFKHWLLIYSPKYDTESLPSILFWIQAIRNNPNRVWSGKFNIKVFQLNNSGRIYSKHNVPLSEFQRFLSYYRMSLRFWRSGLNYFTNLIW